MSEKTGRGGRRPGAGRKPGSLTMKTREIAAKAAPEGVTPLELQLATMRALWADEPGGHARPRQGRTRRRHRQRRGPVYSPEAVQHRGNGGRHQHEAALDEL